MLDILKALASDDPTVVVAAPGEGEGFWAGGPSAVATPEGVWLAYRLRRPVTSGRGYANVVAFAADGLHFETVSTVTSAQFRCASLERPALVRRPDGGWRLYVSCSTFGSKHWWVEALDADTPQGLPTGTRTVVLPGDETEAWKDVVVHAGDSPDPGVDAGADGASVDDAAPWRMWACRHPLDGGDDMADRMSTWYLTSSDGLSWTRAGEALTPTPGTWAARGTRVADVRRADGRWWALYDARRSAEENWRERTGLAVGDGPDDLTAVAGPVPARVGQALRYASTVRHDGGLRVYFETTGADGAHDLRTVLVRS
jgi:hypothetical protein